MLPFGLFVLVLASIQIQATPARRAASMYYQVDDWSGSTFFDHWDFWEAADPTHGMVNYVGASSVWTKGLVYIGNDGVPVMQADSWTGLPTGQKRDSVRIQSKKTFDGGLFIFDFATMPWGCSLWPAVWSYGPSWPNNGEIDIVEGVNLQTKNQMVIHTAEGCYLTNPGAFTGTALSTNCGPSSGGSGCQIEDTSTTSFGQAFNDHHAPYGHKEGGGVFALLWDGDGLQIWRWPSGSVPSDIGARTPNPTTWGTPMGAWAPSSCNPFSYFRQHSLTINIDICGDWAGGSYASSGCGTDCAAQVMDPNNFKTSSFKINSVRTYTADGLSATVNGLGTTYNTTWATPTNGNSTGTSAASFSHAVGWAALASSLMLGLAFDRL